MKEKILIGKPLPPEKLTELNGRFQVDCLEAAKSPQEALLDRLGAYDALLAMGNRVDKELLLRGKKLQVVANCAVGYDNIDVAFAKERGIAVTNTPKATTAPTANMAIGLLLALLRKIPQNDRLLRRPRGLPAWEDVAGFGTHVVGRTLGIIGMGRIGQAVARRALALGMHCHYFSRTRLPLEQEAELGVHYFPFEVLLPSVDVLSLHIPLNAQTRHLLDASALAQMKPGAFILNTARGGVIDQTAMIAALEKGHIAGAGLDVFEEEPYIPQALLHMEQVVLAPHHGTATPAAREAMFQEAFANIVSVLSGEGGISRVV